LRRLSFFTSPSPHFFTSDSVFSTLLLGYHYLADVLAAFVCFLLWRRFWACDRHASGSVYNAGMIASADDARLFFLRWQENTSPVQIKLRTSAIFFDGVGVVLGVNHSALQIGGDSWQFTIPLEGAGFSFSDPREASLASVREAESEKYDFGLSLDLANGDQIALMELKSQPGA
jgi:hypothetical protein